MLAIDRCLMTKQRRSFTPEFKREAAGLVLDQGYSHIEAARSLGLVESALRRWVKQLQEERQGVTPKSKALTPEQQKIQGLDARIDRLGREKAILKSYRSLDVGRVQSYALIGQLSERESVEVVCSAFDVVRSCYYAHRLRHCRVDARWVALRSQVNQLLNQSRGSAGSRSILGMLREDGVSIGRFRGRRA